MWYYSVVMSLGSDLRQWMCWRLWAVFWGWKYAFNSSAQILPCHTQSPYVTCCNLHASVQYRCYSQAACFQSTAQLIEHVWLSWFSCYCASFIWHIASFFIPQYCLSLLMSCSKVKTNAVPNASLCGHLHRHWSWYANTVFAWRAQLYLNSI